jgi:hypothetical protein
MSKHKHTDVRILNAAGGCGYTSRKKADRYVHRKVARWCRDERGRECLEFVKGTPQAAAVQAAVKRTVDQIGYDGVPSVKRFGGAVRYFYQEQMVNQPYTLKRVTAGGEFKHWDDRDRFTPGRFNPDQIAPPLIASQALAPDTAAIQ